jgi:DNA polymerase-4
MHIDMNSYFATVEQQANPLLRGKPIAVGGPSDSRTVVAAASREAKPYGVKSGMTIYEARSLCPHIIFVQGDSEKYAEVTSRFLAIFRDYTPLLEVFSIDEAFLDVTGTEKRFGGARAIASEIKRRLREEVGDYLTCSIGIAPNKLIAKLASDLKKPDGLVVVAQDEIPGLLQTIKLNDLCGIGPRMLRHLHAMGIDTAAKLGAFPLDLLVRRFGKWGYLLHQMGRGEDPSPVVPYYETPEAKSFGHSFTLPRDAHDMESVKKTLLRLCEQVGRRMRAERCAGRTVTLVLRIQDFTTLHRQKTVASFIDDGWEIYRVALGIMEGLAWEGGIRMVGVSVSSLIRAVRQLSLFESERRRDRLIQALDAVNDRYGEFTVARAYLMEVTGQRAGVNGYAVKSTLSF